MTTSLGLTSIGNLTSNLLQRRWQPLLDALEPTSAHRLSESLSSFLPKSWIPRVTALSNANNILPPGYHFVYFNPVLNATELLVDGTDAKHSPGSPFVRRMWAGGQIRYAQRKPLRLDGRAGICVERIRDVTIKGLQGQEKMFVDIERRIGRVRADEQGRLVEREERIVQRLWRDDERDFGETEMIERRNLVFMRHQPVPLQTVEDSTATTILPERRNVNAKRPRLEPSFSHVLIPTAALLFRYSALTMNAHSIHLDRDYCRTVEGHKNLLVHGPLICTLLMTMLQAHLQFLSDTTWIISSFEYRNVAPIYAGDAMKLNALVGSKKANMQHYRLWVENHVGEITVRATAQVREGVSSS